MKKVVLFFTFLWLGTSGAFAQSNKYDLNGDGDVNITDVMNMVNYILGKDNGNVGGDVNVTDVIEMVNYILGQDNGNGSGSGSNSPAEAIDLGLPSGTKWASCNVGATKPEEYGGYYALGETWEKSVYNDVTYKYVEGDVDLDGDGFYDIHDSETGFDYSKFFQELGDISGTEYDVAHVKWGGNWCMPNDHDILELQRNCKISRITLNGVSGSIFTSKINGNSVFFPDTGYRRGGDLYKAGVFGLYWSSTLGSDTCYYNGLVTLRGWTYGNYRCNGLSVRPIVRN